MKGSALALLSIVMAAGCSDTSPLPASGDALDPDASRAFTLVQACTGCHSAAGTAMLALESYDRETLLTALQRYKSESDGTTVMHRLARGYSDADLELISAYAGREMGAE